MGPASAVDQPPDRPGKADCFHGLIANFYSVKAKKIPRAEIRITIKTGKNGRRI